MRWQKRETRCRLVEQWEADDNLFHVVLTRCVSKGTSTGWIATVHGESTSFADCNPARALRQAEDWAATLAEDWLCAFRAEQEQASAAVREMTADSEEDESPTLVLN